MGYMRHDAIVVTSGWRKYLKKARERAVELGLSVSEITEEVTNGYSSFLIAPDGSKERWDESDRGDGRRRAWKDWADAAYKKGVYVQWVHVSFAGDEPKDTKIVQQAEREE